MDDDETESLEIVDPELRQMLGMFDTPAFARRGQDLEHALKLLHARLQRDRAEMLELVRLRLERVVMGVDGPDRWSAILDGPFEDLWSAAGNTGPPPWGRSSVPARKHRGLARELVASVERFNRRWTRLMDGLDLAPLNRMIEHYNRYYLLEKECVLRSSRLAARHFVPYPSITSDDLWASYPVLPVLTLNR